MAMFGGGLEAFRLYGSVGVDTKPAQQGLSELSGQVQRNGGIIQNAMGVALGFLGGAYMKRVIGTGVGMLKGAAIDYNASMEQASIGFTTLLGSAEKAQQFIADMQAFAAKTPFDFPGLQSAANQMLAMGFASDEILPTLTAVGDAVAALGLGSDSVQRVTMALGQMKSAGRVNAQDMNQLTSVGIPAWQLLADSIGKTIPETRKLSELGLIPAQQAIDAITTGIEKGNMGGMMAAQARTFTGAMSTVKDSLQMATGKALKPFFDLLSKVVVGFADWLSTPGATAFFDRIASGVQGVFDAIGGLVGLVGEFGKAWNGMMLKADSPLAPFAAAIGTVSGVVHDLWDQLANFLAPVIRVVSDNFGTIAGVLVGLLTPFGPILTAVKLLSGGLDNIGVTAQNLITTTLASFGGLLEQLLPILGGLLEGILGWIAETVPQLAAGLLTFAGEFVAWVGPMIPVFLDELMGWLNSVVEWIADPGIGIIVDNLLKFAAEFVAWVGPAIPPLLIELGKLLASIGVWVITKGVPGLLGMAVKLGGAIIGGIMDLLFGRKGQKGLLGQAGDFLTQTLIPGLLGFVGELAKAGLDLAASLGKGFVNGLIGFVESGLNTMIRIINGFQIHIPRIGIGPLAVGPFDWYGLKLPTLKLPRLDIGAWNIPAAMVAVLDPGEMVVPARFAEGLREGRGLGGDVVIQVHIGTFHGTEANIDALSRALAERARAARFSGPGG